MENAPEGKKTSGGRHRPIYSFHSDPGKKITRLSAKRKFWVEWECLFDKFPNVDQQEKLKEELRVYIKNYLEQLASGDYGSAIGKSIPKPTSEVQYSSDPSVIEVIHSEIETFFSDKNQDPPEKSFGDANSAFSNEDKIEYSLWDIKRWVQIDEQVYIKSVEENGKREAGKVPLKYTLYSKKWIDIYHHKLVHVSDSYLVFSYQGWFETKNRMRLTDASGENRGTMNPPNPPPPPAG